MQKGGAIEGRTVASLTPCLPFLRTNLLLQPRDLDNNLLRRLPTRKLLVPLRHQKMGTRLLPPPNAHATALQTVSIAMPLPVVSSTEPSRPRKLVAEPLRVMPVQGAYACNSSHVGRAGSVASVDTATVQGRLQRPRPLPANPLRRRSVNPATGLRLAEAKEKVVPPPALPPPRLRDSAADPRFLSLGP